MTVYIKLLFKVKYFFSFKECLKQKTRLYSMSRRALNSLQTMATKLGKEDSKQVVGKLAS